MCQEHPCMRVLVGVLLFCVACSTTPNPASCLDHHCSDPNRPFCDVDGSIGGDPNTCIAVECDPNAFKECREDRALTCNATGDNFDLLDCEFGCDANGCIACNTPDCEKRIVPRYVPNACDELSPRVSFLVDANTEFDTGGSECSAVIQQPSGPEICLIKAQFITIATNQTFRVRGARALALAADYSLDLKGVLDVSADGRANGPAGGILTSGTTADAAEKGGGGAGYRTAGAAGGSPAGVGTAANGGPAGENPVLLTDLFGGRRTAQLGDRPPGGGGGAATLIACRRRITLTGVVDAGGGGGSKSQGIAGAIVTPPTGGGTGGTIVLQGAELDVTGQLFANGGGGGGGGDDLAGGGNATSGLDGQRSLMGARGGLGYGGGGSGGDGGTDAQPSGGGGTSYPGAGGGSAGYIVIYVPKSVENLGTPVAVSPSLEPRQDIPLR
jgi:hypothetical protein